MVFRNMERPEEIMIIGMFIIGRILAIKMFSKPSQNGIGVNPSLSVV